MALIDNLVSYWKLDEASGTREDAHGSNDLTDNNTVVSDPGKINDAAEFVDANSESLTHASNSDLQGGDTDWTFAAWVKFNDLSGEPGIASKDGEWGLYYSTGNGRLQGYIVDTTPANNHAFFPGFTINTGVWYLIFLINDSTANELAIAVNNETPQAWSYGAAVPRTTSGDFIIGRDIGLAAYGSELIDEAGWWKKKFSADDRAAMWGGGNGLPYPFSSYARLDYANPGIVQWERGFER